MLLPHAKVGGKDKKERKLQPNAPPALLPNPTDLTQRIYLAQLVVVLHEHLVGGDQALELDHAFGPPAVVPVPTQRGVGMERPPSQPLLLSNQCHRMMDPFMTGGGQPSPQPALITTAYHS